MKMKYIYFALVFIIVLLIVGFSMKNSGTGVGEKIPNLGNKHIPTVSSPHQEYNSSPPTSGPHVGSIANWGMHDEQIEDERQVHNLEDGGVMIQYHPEKITNQEVDTLKQIYNDLGRRHVIVAPYSDMEYRIALTAWNRLLGLETVDTEMIRAFVEKYEGIDHHVKF